MTRNGVGEDPACTVLLLLGQVVWCAASITHHRHPLLEHDTVS